MASQNPLSYPGVSRPQGGSDNGVVLDDYVVISKLRNQLIVYRTDITERNTYIDVRDRYLYGDGLFEGLYFPDGFDLTMYNYLRRVVDIHTAQMMPSKFGIYSHYDKQDLTQMQDAAKDGDKDAEAQLKMALIQNRERETKAQARRNLIEAMIRDNGGFRIFKDGARVGSAYGSTLYQMWWDDDDKKIRIQLLESIQNWFPMWADNNFREREGDAYVLQISLEQANRKYAHLLPAGDSFPVSYAGDPLINIQGAASTLTNQQGETVSSAVTRRPMVTVISYTGYLPNVKYDKDGNFVECDDGEETIISFKSVGNIIASRTTDPNFMPKFYYIPNETVPRRPYGESDIPKSALDINQTILQQLSNEVTLANKTLFPLIKAKGFDIGTIPPRSQREITVVPMQPEQDLEVMAQPTNAEGAFDGLVQRLIDAFIRVTKISRPLFEDIGSPSNSAQAQIGTMKPIIDTVEDKRSRWEPVLKQMFTDALNLAAKHDKNVAKVMEDDTNWWLYVRWPSIMRQDDPVHQSMLLNDFMHGLRSVQSYMEERGIYDVEQEIARLENDLEDKTRAAILGNRMGELAQFTIYKALGVPLWGFNVPKIMLRGDLTPQQEANMGAMQGWNDPNAQLPFGASIGPQGSQGDRENQNFINQGFGQQVPGSNQPFVSGLPQIESHYGLPAGVTPGQAIQPNNPGGANPAQMMTPPGAAVQGMPGPNAGRPFSPIITTAQNQGGQPSAAGGHIQSSSSAAGMVKQSNQRRRGK